MQQTLMLQQLAQRGLNQQQLQQVLQSHALQNLLGPGKLPQLKPSSTHASRMIPHTALDTLASLRSSPRCTGDYYSESYGKIKRDIKQEGGAGGEGAQTSGVTDTGTGPGTAATSAASPAHVAAPAGPAVSVAGGGVDEALQEALQETQARLETGSLKRGIFLVLRDAGPAGVTSCAVQ